MTAADLRHWVTVDDFKEDGTPVVFAPSRMPVAIYPDSASTFDEDRKGHVVWMRYHPQVTTNTRLWHRNRQLAVRGINNVNERNEWLELRCEEVLTP
jgi:hypothetical protein